MNNVQKPQLYSVVWRKLPDIKKGIATAHAIAQYSDYNLNDELFQAWTHGNEKINLVHVPELNELQKLADDFERVTPISRIYDINYSELLISFTFIADKTNDALMQLIDQLYQYNIFSYTRY